MAGSWPSWRSRCPGWPTRSGRAAARSLGIATGLSLAIGLEMMIYLALLGGATVLLWVADRDQRRRLAAYAGALVATTGAGFLLFASDANRQAVCDALSPVWLSDAAVGGAVMLGLAMLKLDSWKARLRRGAGSRRDVGRLPRAGLAALPAAAGRRVAGGDRAVARPCPRGASPSIATAGGSAVMALARYRRPRCSAGRCSSGARGRRATERRELLRRTLAVALPAVAALALLFWQIRAGPAAQMMALPAATALIVLFAGRWLDVAQAVAACRGRGGGPARIWRGRPGRLSSWSRQSRRQPTRAKVSQANSRCPSLAALAPINRQPKGMIFTFIDLGPRLIVATHHDAIGGPYHRNDKAIADVMKAFRGDEAQAHRIIDEYRSDYLLICPDMSTATIFMTEAPKGFYGQLDEGQGAGLAAAGRAAARTRRSRCGRWSR